VTTGDDLRSIADRVDGMDKDYAVLKAAMADKDALIAQLQQQLADCQNPTPEPTPTPTVSGLIGWNSADSRMGARRLYSTGSNYGSLKTDVPAITGKGQTVLLSAKPEVPDSALQALAPYADKLWLAHYHEPEDNIDGPTFVKQYEARRAAMPPEIQARMVPCLMEYTFRARPYETYIPPSCDAIALDGYNWWNVRAGDPWREPAAIWDKAVGIIQAMGKKVFIWETNACEDPANPNRKADWIRHTFDYCEAHDIEQVSFFDAHSGQPGYGKFKLLSSPAAEQAVAEGLARPFWKRA